MNRIKYRGILCLSLCLILCIEGNASAIEYQVFSPDKQNKATFFVEDGTLAYSFEQNGEVVIRKSKLGLKIEGAIFDNLRFVKEKRTSHRSEWHPVWGVQSTVPDNYNALLLRLKDSRSKSEFELKIRLYNEGLAFKYEGSTAAISSLKLEKEQTEFYISGNFNCWMLAHPWGKKYMKDVLLNEVENASLPILAKSESEKYVLITEAELYNYGSMHLSANTKGILCADIVGEVHLKPHFSTPWRVIMAANSPDYFVEHKYLIQNLNPPSKIEDTSWIKPGICTWDWRARGAVEQGFTYKLNTETLTHFVDKTAELGLPYFMVDAGWYGVERDRASDPLTAIPGINMNAFMNRAKEMNVGIWLYVNRIAFEENDIDELLSAYKKWGVVGIKLGFLKEMNQSGVEFLQKVVEKCAEFEIMFNCHECVIPSGIERTYPHFLTREYNHSLLDGRHFASPVDHTITPFLNNIAGPIDVTPGFFDIDNLTVRKYVRGPLRSTVVAQAAMCLTYDSPMLCLPDIPEAYQRKSDLFGFIKSLPLVYDESKVLIGNIEKLFLIARRKGQDWWIAGVCNEEGAQIKIDLNILDEGEYGMVLFTDGKDASWEKNRETYSTQTKVVSREDVFDLKIAPGGGVCLKLEKIHK